MKKLAILGSTGSIGRQTLEVVRRNTGKFSVVALTAGHNIDLLRKQVSEFRPKMVALYSREKARQLKQELKGTETEVLEGEEGIVACAAYSESDLVVNGLVGISGLVPTFKAVEEGKDIALANKETLISGGEIIMSLAAKRKVNILPVDSEHSAIFQCIGNTPESQVKKILLTASGGPFRGRTREGLKHVTVQDALKHPNWKMGSKITVDSATLMNKGMEIIEARWLFNLEPEKIQVVIHPQSIIHSMVEFVDGSVLAQLGYPDMRIPIQYALTFPERIASGFSEFNPVKVGPLEFYPPDTDTFPSLKLAYAAMLEGGTMPAVMNGANEVAVESFLTGRLPFLGIPEVVEEVMNRHTTMYNPSLEDIIFWDKWSRREAVCIIKRGGGKYW